MKRIVASCCLLAVMLMLVACPHIDMSASQGSSTIWPTQSTVSSGTLTQFFPMTGTSSVIPILTTSSKFPSITTLPTIPTTFPTIPTTLPTIPTTFPTIPTTLPTIPTTLPTVPTTLPTIPTTLPTVPTTLPTIPTTLPTVPTTLPTIPTTRPTVPTTSQTKPTEPTEADDVVPTQWVVADCNCVNLRKRADVNSKSLGLVYAGSKVKVIGWNGRFAKVQYKNMTGYIMACYLQPANQFLSAVLDTVEVTNTYTYDQMIQDLISFDMKYPDLVELETIGYSALDVEIPVIRIGDVNAEKHVLLHGGIHGREHMTTWLLMALMDYWLDRDLLSYGDVCYHVIPMVNPDGATISQTGVLPDELMYIYQNDLKKGYTSLSVTEYAKLWKANGQGVDLNRNFDAGWEKIDDRTGPSSEGYKGTAPFCAPESVMLRDYTHRYTFDLTISYHAMGSLIYFEYGDNDAVNDQGYDLANELNDLSGYFLLNDDGASSGGYKDWAIEDESIPSLTIEIGCQSVPLSKRELYSIFVRNLEFLPTMAEWLTE